MEEHTNGVFRQESVNHRCEPRSGCGVTEWLADNGAHVLAVGRSTENLSRSRVEYLALDLSSQENTSKLVQHANEFEPDTVVHALGGGFGLSNDLVTPEDFLHLVQPNFLAFAN